MTKTGNCQEIDLNGTWRLQGTGSDGKSFIDFQAQIPGMIHLDLLREGIIPEPFWREQAEQCQWVERHDWTYERFFDVPDDNDLGWVVLRFEGLDTFAAIILNGTEIARCSNMFIPHEFEVGDILKYGRNHIRIQFDSIWKHLNGKRLNYPCAFDNQERLHVRRIQCTFHWDWVNRFVSCGIWKPVKLMNFKFARLLDLFVYTKSIEPKSANVHVDVQMESRTNEPIFIRTEIVDPEGGRIYSDEIKFDNRNLGFDVLVANPSLWWPNGYGEHPLYRVEITLADQEGNRLDSKYVYFGIRTVEVRQEKDAPGSFEAEKTGELRRLFPELDMSGERPGRGFKLLINGIEIFCKGGNWVPADPFPSRITSDWYERLIRLVHDGNQNMLRCWGGGIYEKEEFWDDCNRYGIMVCQDFMMACAQYPEDDPAFMEKMKQEIPTAIRMLRNHPCLVWWFGDNENGMHFAEDEPECWGRKIFEEITKPACSSLDPSRPLFPTSPFGGVKNNALTIGDCHNGYSPSGDQDFAYGLKDYKEKIAQMSIGRFLSETPSYGAPALSSILKFMTMADASDPDNRMLEFHSKNNPYAREPLIVSQFRRSEVLFGKPDTLLEKIAFLEYLQYEWVRLVMENIRRERFYCGGILFWMYNDCWPANGWSLVDYYGIPKAGWYAMKRASQPVICSIQRAENGFNFWICNDSMRELDGKMTFYRQGWTSKLSPIRSVSVKAPANRSLKAMSVSDNDIGILGKEEVLICVWTEGRNIYRAWYYNGVPKEMLPPKVKLEARHSGQEIIIRADSYARTVTLEGEVDFSDNYFEMIPGEERGIVFSQRIGCKMPEEIIITCWNIEEDVKLRINGTKHWQ